MKALWTMLATVAITTGAALAQVYPSTTTTVTTSPTMATVTTAPAVCPPGTVMTTPVCPPGTVATTSAVTSTTMVCANTLAYPAPCAAKATTDITGHPIVLVLGREEQYGISNLHVHNLDYRDVALSNDVSSPYNPLMNNYVNAAISRHGNPYYPYYALSSTTRVAGVSEVYSSTGVYTTTSNISFPRTVSSEDRATLSAVADRYRNLTPQQAMAMGYQPLGACIPNVGNVYINQSLINNQFDPMTPEAFSFDNNGRIIAVHYILLSSQPIAAFGQPFQPSPLVQGALQLPVWLYERNRRGMFMLQNSRFNCR